MILAFGLALWPVAGTGLAIAADDPCGCNNNNDGCNPPGFWTGSEAFPRAPWYVSTDGIALQRLFGGLGPAAYSTLTNSVALSQQDLGTPFQSGVQFLVGHTFDDSPYQVEVSYFWVSSWDTSATVVDPSKGGNLLSPFTDFGFFPDNSVDYNNTVSIHEISRLEGGEINLKYLLPLPAGDPSITLMFGVRHVGIREEFDYSSEPTKNVNPVSVHAHTNNDLWGPQIGGVVEYGHQDVWIRVEGKAAICNNDTDRDLNANVNGIEATHPRLSQNNTATVGDISAALRWRPTSALTAQVGYRALWCDQLALTQRNFAPDLASLTNAAVEPPINTRGTLIYHGPFAGLQLNW
jgi:hypothetical protein